MNSQSMNPNLYDLSRTFPKHLIEPAPRGKYGDYIPHFVINQALLAYVGPFDWELVEIIRGFVDEQVKTDKQGNIEKTYPALPNAIVAVVMRLTVTIDGRPTTITESGECDAGAFETSDGKRLKKAMSDALKRCAMRVGLGLHMWCKTPEQYFLQKILMGDTSAPETSDEVHVAGVDDEEVY